MTQSPRRNIFIDKSQNPCHSLTQIFTNQPQVPKTSIYRSSSLSEKLKLEKQEMGESGSSYVEKRKFQKFKIFSSRDQIKSTNHNEFQCGPAQISQRVSNISNQNNFVEDNHQNYENKTLKRTKMSREGRISFQTTKQQQYVLFSGVRSPVQSLGQIVDLNSQHKILQSGDKKRRKSFSLIKFTRKAEVDCKADVSKQKANVKIFENVKKIEKKAKSEVDSECKQFQIDQKDCCQIICPSSNRNSYFYENLEYKNDESVKQNDFFANPDDLLETKSIQKACSIEQNIANVHSQTVLAWNLKRITQNSIDEHQSRVQSLQNKPKIVFHEKNLIDQAIKRECKTCWFQKQKVSESCALLTKKLKQIDELVVKLVNFIWSQKQTMMQNMNNFKQMLFQRMEENENNFSVLQKQKMSELYLANEKLKSDNEKKQGTIQQLKNELSQTLLQKTIFTSNDICNTSHCSDKKNIEAIGKIVKKSPRSSNNSSSVDLKQQIKFENVNHIRHRIEFHKLNLETENESCDFFSASPATTIINTSRFTPANRNSRMKNRVQSLLQQNSIVGISKQKHQNLQDSKQKSWNKQQSIEGMQIRVNNSKQKFGKIISKQFRAK